ncbi:replication protein RepA [Ralstonia insidiosa]|uniref:replication protein RepA n=1 Tax=Ralstonia insidiosa TaxID=190721 RepID=UPI000A8A0C35|nr:replication protein RepA [Ralstonia insidiosa]
MSSLTPAPVNLTGPEQHFRPRPSEERLVKAAAEIDAHPPAGDDIAFTHSILCQVGLPRKQVSKEEFVREFKDAWISVSAGYLDEGNGPVKQPVPFGAVPRLAIAYLNTYALRHKTREIPVGSNSTDLLRLIGQHNDGGNRYLALRRGIHALAACRLQIGYRGRTFNGQPIEQFDAWSSSPEAPRHRWPGVLVLSKSYFESLENSGVPLDRRALRAIGGAALDLDVYAWLTHRLWRINQPETISWRALQGQFGQEYADTSNFRKEMKRALNTVLAVYPKARKAIEQVNGGLRLKHAPPPVSPRDKCP